MKVLAEAARFHDLYKRWPKIDTVALGSSIHTKDIKDGRWMKRWEAFRGPVTECLWHEVYFEPSFLREGLRVRILPPFFKTRTRVSTGPLAEVGKGPWSEGDKGAGEAAGRSGLAGC